MTKKTDTVTAYKAFDANMRCRGFQYEVGATYQHDGDVRFCNAGFHACENPFDVLFYYDLVGSRFGVVTLGDVSGDRGDDSKIAGARITVDAELGLPGFIRAAVDWIIQATKGKKENGGDYAKIGSSGDHAQIGSSGGGGQIGSSGDYARIGSSGDYAQIGSSGDHAQIGSSGDCAQIGSSGDCARIEAEGRDAVIASAGCGARIKAAKGAWVSLAEYDDTSGKCVGFATGQIGKGGLRPDTWYCARGGKLVEV